METKQESLVPAGAAGHEGTGLQPGRAANPVPVQLGIAPHSLEEGWRLAQVMAKSALVPKNFQNKPEDVLVAIQLGIEVGLAPMQALQSIAVINGRPSVWGDGFLALIMASSSYLDHDEYYEVKGQRVDGLTAEDLKLETTAAICTFHRRGKATPTTQRFTVGMAKKASLLGKEGPWGSYPDRMLKMRARSWAGRDAFPDVLRGMTTAEEAMDIPSDPPAPVRPVITMPQRKSDSVPAPAGAPAMTSVGEPENAHVEPSGGASAAETAEPEAESQPSSVLPVQPVGVRIKDVVVTRKKGEPTTAHVIDEHGVSYSTDDASVILAAHTAKEKGYVMEITTERRGDESVILEINRVQAPEATGK